MISKKSITFHVLAALLLLIVLIAKRIPAQLVFLPLEKQPLFTQTVHYSDIEGSIWSGKLNNLSIRYGTADIPLGNTQWQINPLYLLLGKVQLHLLAEAPQQSIKGDIAISATKTITLSNMQLQAPMGIVSQIYPVPGFVEGEIAIVIKELALNTSGLLAIEANANIRNLKYTLSQPVELGSFQIVAAMKNDKVIANISDTVAQLGVSGNVKFTPKTRLYEVDMNLVPKATANPLIDQTLSQFLRQSSAGVYQITKSAQL